MASLGSMTSDLISMAERSARNGFKKASNSFNGPAFNHAVLDEVAKDQSELTNERVEVEGESDDEWTAISRAPVKPGSAIYATDSFVFRPEPNPKSHLHPLPYMIPQQTVDTVCDALGVSKDFARTALHFFVATTSRSTTTFNWLLHCQSTTDVVRAVRRRFAALEELQMALQGYPDHKLNPDGSIPSRFLIKHNWLEDVAHAQDLPRTDLADLPVLTDEAIRAYLARAINRGKRLMVSSQGKEVFDERVHGELQVVFEGVNHTADRSRLEMKGIWDARGFREVSLSDNEDDENERFEDLGANDDGAETH